MESIKIRYFIREEYFIMIIKISDKEEDRWFFIF